jgi:hypothetical protein
MVILVQKFLDPVRGSLRVGNHPALVVDNAAVAFEGATGDEDPFNVGWSGVEAPGSCETARCKPIAAFILANVSLVSLVPPSSPSPILMLRAYTFRTRAMPAASRMFDNGLCATRTSCVANSSSSASVICTA